MGDKNKHAKSTYEREFQLFISIVLKLKQHIGLERALKGGDASVINQWPFWGVDIWAET